MNSQEIPLPKKRKNETRTAYAKSTPVVRLLCVQTKLQLNLYCIVSSSYSLLNQHYAQLLRFLNTNCDTTQQSDLQNNALDVKHSTSINI